MTPEEIIRRGKDAASVLENPAYKDAVSKITQDIRSLRLQLSPKDTEGAYQLVLMEQVVEKTKRLMEQYLQDAESAAKELEREELPGPLGRLGRKFQKFAR